MTAARTSRPDPLRRLRAATATSSRPEGWRGGQHRAAAPGSPAGHFTYATAPRSRQAPRACGGHAPVPPALPDSGPSGARLCTQMCLALQFSRGRHRRKKAVTHRGPGQGAGAGSRGSAPAGPSSQGPPPVSLGGVPVRTPLGGPEPRTARRGAAAEGHRKRPLSASYTARVRPKRPVPVCAKYRATGALRARASEAEHRTNGEPRLTARHARRSPGRERTPAPARSVRPCGSSVK